MPFRPALRSGLLIAVALAGCQGVSAIAPVASPTAFPRLDAQVLVKLKPGVDASAVRARYGITQVDPLLPGVERWHVGGDQAPETWAERLKGDAACEFAQPNYLRQTQAYVNPNLSFDTQWYLGPATAHGLAITDAWATCSASPPGAGVLVAVVDTGVDIDHPDLGTAIATDSNGTKLFYNELGTDRVDDNGHGTHVAGILGGRGVHAGGVVGVAPGVRILPVKTMDAAGNGDDFTIAKGFKDAVDAGADIVNFSVGGEAPSPILAEALAYGFQRGTLFVIAAGNSGGQIFYPAAYAGVVAVGATTTAGLHASYSNWGPQLTVVAPGGDPYATAPSKGIYSTLPTYATFLSRTYGKGPNYGVESGTSMATPVVSGLAALIMAEARSRGVRLTPAQVHARISATAQDVAPAGFDDDTGFGFIQPLAALSQVGDVP